jgi:hypothetical protein
MQVKNILSMKVQKSHVPNQYIGSDSNTLLSWDFVVNPKVNLSLPERMSVLKIGSEGIMWRPDRNQDADLVGGEFRLAS